MNRLLGVLCLAQAALWSSAHRALAETEVGHHPPMAQQQYVLEVGFSDATGPQVVRAPIDLADPTAPATFDQTVALPAPLTAIHVREFLPDAQLRQEARRDNTPGALPATLVSIEGPTQSIRRWLVAGDPQRNRVTSLIGTWRFMTADDRDDHDQLLQDFETEHTRPPMLHVARPNGSSAGSFLAEPGTIHEVPGLSGRLRVRAFYPHYAISDKTNKPTNLSFKRVNPAILIELEAGDIREQRWVFAQFPDYTTGVPQRIPWKVTLDCPAEGKAPRPDMAAVFTRPSTWEVWIRHAGRTQVHDARPDTYFDVPSSQYRFRLEQLIPSARLVESYRPVDDQNGVQAIRVESVDEAGRPVAIWLTPNKLHIMSTRHGSMTLRVLTEFAQDGGHP